jgi:hypothetical protein
MSEPVRDSPSVDPPPDVKTQTPEEGQWLENELARRRADEAQDPVDPPEQPIA